MNRNKYALLSPVSLVILLLLTLSVSLAQDALPDCPPPESDCPNTFTINIPAGVNVRSIEAGSLGQADSTLPGNAEVIGWLDPAGTPLAARDSGTWLVMMTTDGEYQAVAARLVTQTDDIPVTDEEAATTPQFVYDGAGFAPVPEVVGTETSNTTVETMPTAVQESIFNPELVPQEITVTYKHYPVDELRTETIQINRESAFLPTGLITEGQFPLVDQWVNFGELGPNGVERAVISGYIIEFSETEFNRYMTLAYETNDGEYGYVSAKFTPWVRLVPVDSEVNPLGDDPFILYEPLIRISERGIQADINIQVGDQIILMLEDPANDNERGGMTRTNREFNNITDGQATHIIEQVNAGELPATTYIWTFAEGIFYYLP